MLFTAVLVMMEALINISLNLSLAAVVSTVFMKDLCMECTFLCIIFVKTFEIKHLYFGELIFEIINTIIKKYNVVWLYWQIQISSFAKFQTLCFVHPSLSAVAGSKLCQINIMPRAQ